MIVIGVWFLFNSLILEAGEREALLLVVHKNIVFNRETMCTCSLSVSLLEKLVVRSQRIVSEILILNSSV